MNLTKVMDFGRLYVVFARGRQYRGRAIRISGTYVDLACGNQVTRLGAREVKAVLQPSTVDEERFYA